jgi:hypothetical protein
MVVHTSNPSPLKAEQENREFKATLSYIERPQNTNSWEGSSVVEHLPNVLQALALIPSTAKKRQQQQQSLIIPKDKRLHVHIFFLSK